MCNENKQKKRIKRWCEKEKRKGEQSEHRQLKTHTEQCKIDVDQSNCETIKRWIMNLKRKEKKVE